MQTASFWACRSVATQLVPAVALGDNAFGQALRAITTVSLLSHFKDELVHTRKFTGSPTPGQVSPEEQWSAAFTPKPG